MGLGTFHFQLLYNVLENIHFMHDETELAQAVLDKVAGALNAEAGSIFKLSETGVITPLASFGAPIENLRKMKFSIGKGVIGWVAEFIQPVKVDNPAKDTRFMGTIDQSTGFKTRSIIAAPILAKGKAIGIIEFLNRKDGPFANPDIELISMVGREIGIAFENAKLIRSMEIARSFQEAVLNSLAAGVVVMDEDLRVLTMNPRAREILRFDDDAKVPPASKVFAAMPQLGEAVKSIDKPLMRQEMTMTVDGKSLTIGYSGVPVIGKDAARLGTAVLFQDITAYVK